MKTYILGMSLGASGLATMLGIYSVIGNSHLSLICAGMTGLFGIASFFVGLAYPSTVVDTQTFDKNTNIQTNTRKFN